MRSSKLWPRAQLLALGRIGEQLVLDQELHQHAALGGLGQGAQIVADLGLGELHVRIGDGLAVDLGDHALLRCADAPAASRPSGEQAAIATDKRCIVLTLLLSSVADPTGRSARPLWHGTA